MREIKFRAWDKVKKEMKYQHEGFHEDGEYNGCWYIAEFRMRENAPNSDFEIMQYTGLKDKNGKEIYEGDIIKCDGIVTEVFFGDGAFETNINLDHWTNNLFFKSSRYTLLSK